MAENTSQTKVVKDDVTDQLPKPTAADDADKLAKLTAEMSLKEVTDQRESIPSQVTDRKWVYAGSSEEYQRQDDPFGGKWLIFLSEVDKDKDNLTTLDKAWVLIEQATVENTFYQSKVSTAIKEPYATDDGNGVIVIYTQDFEDVDDIYKTAKNIESVLKNYLTKKNYIRYKTNAATEARLYPSQNCKNVTNYRYSKMCGLQVRDPKTFWVQAKVKDSENKCLYKPNYKMYKN